MTKAVTIWLIIMAIKIAVLSVVTFCIYAWDKLQAKRSGWRVPEANLHLLALLGGWPGAYFAQSVIRHKNTKQRFQTIFKLTIAGYIMIAGSITYLVWTFSQPD